MSTRAPDIFVTNLTKTFQVYQKKPGLWGSIESLWHRKHYPVTAVDHINFEIKRGEIVGFIGQNGAGKTTTLKMLSGLLYPTSGEVSVLGHNPWDRKPDFQKQFALVMGQKNQLWWDLPPMETFLLNKAIYEIPDAQFRKTLDNLVEMLDVESVIRVQTRKLSLGQRMKCELIASLLHNPQVLFLDEPTIGLDVVMQKTVRDFIKQYNKEFGATIILTSHYMEDVRELCKRAIVIHEGKKMFDGALSELINQYARNKILSLTFDKTIPQQALKKLGTLKSHAPGSATLLVPRQQATKAAAQLLQQFTITDVTIEEPPIEAIIREVFAEQTSTANAAKAAMK